MKPKIFLTSNVFSAEEIGENRTISENIRQKIKTLWKELKSKSQLKVFEGRFPTESQIRNNIEQFDPQIIGCHLSHTITREMLENSNVFAVSTSTAGFNHIERPEEDDIIITHTPGVLFETVADYTISLIMANLRNLIDLHKYVWEGNWSQDEKWDLDQKLSSVIDNKTVGIIGLGEIGAELMKRLYSWGVKIIYYDIAQNKDLEKSYPKLQYKKNIEDVFKEADIVSIHVPLNAATKHLVDSKLLKLMKRNALLINTARGPVINFNELLDSLENGEIKINIAFDVYPKEPIDPGILKRFKKIKQNNPDLRMILMPHNASADADTRGKMDLMFLSDIIQIIDSKRIENLEKINLIPPHRKKLYDNEWRIQNYWD